MTIRMGQTVEIKADETNTAGRVVGFERDDDGNYTLHIFVNGADL